MSPRDTDDSERPTSSNDGHVPVEVSLGADTDEQPPVESNTRIDIIVDRESYPTARLDDGRYVAWWFTADAPEPDASVTSEWVTAPTRFLAAGTLHELWENPGAFDSLTAQG